VPYCGVHARDTLGNLLLLLRVCSYTRDLLAIANFLVWIVIMINYFWIVE